MNKGLIFDCGDHKIEFSSENYKDFGREYFRWGCEIIQIFKQSPEYDGWRLPTASEMQYLIDNYMCMYGYGNSIKDSEQACIFDNRLVLPNKGWQSDLGGIVAEHRRAAYWVCDDGWKSFPRIFWGDDRGPLCIEKPLADALILTGGLPIRLCRTVKEETNNTSNIDNIKELNIVAPAGYTIDEENSTFKKIVFKRIEEKPWRSRENTVVSGWWISEDSKIYEELSFCYDRNAHNIFATEKQVKSALAMAQISQIMVNDERFGGSITDEELSDDRLVKYAIVRYQNAIEFDKTRRVFHFLSFHTPEQRALFLKENEDLVKDYLMLD